MLPGVFHAFARFVDDVQDLSITVNAGSATGSVTPSPAVDWDRTLIVIRGHANTLGSGDVAAESFYLDISGANLRLNRTGGAGDGNTTVYVTLIQFKPGVIRKITRGTISNVGTGTGTYALGTAVDLAKVELRWLGTLLTANVNDDLGRIDMQNSTTVRHIGGSGSSTSIASFELVERY